LARMSWRFQRLAISAFLVFHVAMLAAWNLPNCPLRERCADLAAYYLYPLGLWQSWGMFAPNPQGHTIMLEAIAIDKNGILYNFAFPKMSDYTFWERVPRARHPKFASYFGSDEFAANREVAARHVVRQLNIPPDSFPVEVELQFQVKETPPPGKVPDPMAPPVIQPIKAYRYPRWEDPRP
jgi:hypothetical protein